MSNPYPGANPDEPGRGSQAGPPGPPAPPPPPYPSADQPGQQARRPMPAVVNYLSIGLFILVALQVLGAVLALVNMQSAIDTAMSEMAGSANVSQEQAESFARTGIIASVIISLVIAALFAWLTIMVRKGRNWARITATVLLGLGILFGLFSFSGAAGAGGTAVLGVITLLLEIAILVMLWLRPSSEYFRQGQQPG